jgi:hypothetical protein
MLAPILIRAASAHLKLTRDRALDTDCDRLPIHLMPGVWISVLIVLVVLAGLSWITETVTLQDHWTLYAVRCDRGAWHGTRCSGRLVPAERHSFLANKSKGTVAFTIIGASMASGTLSQCAIKGGRDWTCQEASSGAQPITLKLSGGHLAVDPVVKLSDVRPISKWKWLFLRIGIPVGSEATQ